MTAIVFLGPSAPADYALAKGLDVRPPARMGDVYEAVLSGSDAIGIVDGVFEHSPAVWHKEVLFALSKRIPVFGGASMGALRACELNGFGMTGIGRIYRDFRSGAITDDDEVAIIHAAAEDGYRTLSEAMVNIRFGLEAALREGLLDQSQHDKLVRDSKDCFYPTRSWQRVFDAFSVLSGETAARALQAFIEEGSFDLKLSDAIEVVDAVASCALSSSSAPAPAPDFEFEWTWHWDQGVVRGRSRSAEDRGPTWDVEALGSSGNAPGAEGALFQLLCDRAATDAGLRTNDSAALAQFRLARGLGNVGVFHTWLRDNRLDPRQCLALARHEAAVQMLFREHADELGPLLSMARRHGSLTPGPAPMLTESSR